MAQSLNLNIKGLHTYASELSGVPQGALSVADDVNISRANIVEPRRGFDFLGYDPAGIVKKILFYNGEFFVHYSTTLAIFSAGFSSRGTLTTPADAISVKSVSMNDNLYITNSTGISKLDDTATAIYAAGIPKGTLVEANGVATNPGSAVTTSSSVAYRYVLARKDANNNTVTGGVSGRYVVTVGGTAGDYDIPLKIYIPSSLDNTYYAQVYRTASTSGTPSDEMQLCYEYPLTSGDASAGYFTFTDITPDALLGASLYTSPSQQGIVNDNTPPPLARDISSYKNHLFFADIVSKHRFTITLISAGSPGLQINDTVTITRGATVEVYTAKAAANVGNKEFDLDTSASPAIDIDYTARSLVSVINQGSALVYAYLLSTGDGDLPGKILLEERTYGNAAFTVISSRAAAWSPQLQATAGTSQTSSNDEFKNGLMFSKSGIPEAVPLKNIFRIGASDDRIKRIVPLRDGLFIFKERDGIYVLRGEDETSFTVSLLDGTAKIASPDSLATVSNLIYGLFAAGVCEVSDSGVEIVGLPIKDRILELSGVASDEISSYGFGIGYDTEGKYILCLPTVNGATSAAQQFVFDVYGRSWCRWTLNMRSGGINPANDKLYYGAGDSAKVRVERKIFSYTDFVDYGATCTISAYSTTTVTVDNTSGMGIGDVLKQGDALAYIESINTNDGTVVIDITQTWTTGAATVEHLKAIYCKVEWNPEFADNPSGYKQFFEGALLFKQVFQKDASVYFYSDSNPSESSIVLESSSGNGSWGGFEWGLAPWGGESAREPIRFGIPRPASRCNLLSIRFESRVAYSNFQLNGISLSYNPTSTRIAR